MEDKKLDKFQKILKEALDRAKSDIDPEDVKKIFETMLQMKQGLMADAQKLKEAHDSVMAMLESKVEKGMSESEQKMMDTMKSEMEKMMKMCEDKMATMKNGEDGAAGMDADEEAMMQQMHQPIVDDVVSRVEKDLPQLGTAIRDGLELLTGDERLDKSAIKGLDEELKKITDVASTKSSGGGRTWGGTGFYDLSAQTNGTLKVFSVPKGLAGVAFSSDFPMVLMEGRGFSINANRTEITLTTTEAPSSGSQLLYQYTKIFS
jgi:hypothetical protein